MRVTLVEELTKTRSKVYLDGEFAFVLYKGELRHYQMREGEELSEEDYRTIMEETLPKRAKLRAMNLLQKKDYTVESLRRKLHQGGYPEAVVEEALSYVASYRYTDDLRYAVDYITCHDKDRSRMRIEHDLASRGISGETLEKAWDQWQEQGGVMDEQAMIMRLLQKKNYDPERTDRKEQQRVYAFLMRKGFPAEAILRAMKV